MYTNFIASGIEQLDEEIIQQAEVYMKGFLPEEDRDSVSFGMELKGTKLWLVLRSEYPIEKDSLNYLIFAAGIKVGSIETLRQLKIS